MSNFIRWNGISESGQNAKDFEALGAGHPGFKWETAKYKWSDVQLVGEAILTLGGSKNRKQRQN